MPFPLDYVDDGDWERVRANTDATAQRLNPVLPQARVYNSVNIGIPDSTGTALTFDSERYDNGDLHSTSVNTSRLTAPVTGLYSMGASIEWGINAVGIRQLLLRRNAGAFIVADLRAAVSAIQQSVHTEYRLAAGDYVEVVVVQTSGGALNVLADPAFSAEFWMHRVGGYVNTGVN